jgi:hypothetical protein
VLLHRVLYVLVLLISPFDCHRPHLLLDVRKLGEKFIEVVFRHDQELALTLGNRSHFATSLSRAEKHVDVTKVGALHIDVYWQVSILDLRSVVINVVVEFDPAAHDEEDFFSMVSLTVQRLILEYLHLTEHGQHGPDQVLALIIKETDLTNDFSVRVLHHLPAKECWQLAKQFLLIKLLQVLLMVVFEEAFYADFDLVWQLRASNEFR